MTNTRWKEITAIWQKDIWLYGLIGALAGFILGVAASGELGQFVIWFADGFWNEALSIAITVIVLDRLNERRALEKYKQALKYQAGSVANSIAIDAIEQLSKNKWLGGDNGVLKHTDLRDANLEKARLQYANLEWTNLMDANLQDANLESANLDWATLESVNLQGTNLRDAKLWLANLRYAKLQSAILVDAKLQEADLEFANLYQADLYQANLQSANLYQANLRNAKNITLAKFSKGTVLPDAEINDLESLSDNYNQYSKYWTEDTDMTCYTNPEHPDFWEPPWVKEQREEADN